MVVVVGAELDVDGEGEGLESVSTTEPSDETEADGRYGRAPSGALVETGDGSGQSDAATTGVASGACAAGSEKTLASGTLEGSASKRAGRSVNASAENSSFAPKPSANSPSMSVYFVLRKSSVFLGLQDRPRLADPMEGEERRGKSCTVSASCVKTWVSGFLGV